MPNKVSVSTLNASTYDILNVIRANASPEYQAEIPVVTQNSDIPKVGAKLLGYPALANHFLNALVNRIAIVSVKSAVFNNPYAILKKGYLEFGETVEDVFVNIAKVVDYNPDKAAAREFKRTLPDVRSAFHCINWRVMYPVTIQEEDLRQAFLSINGVQDMIAKIVDSVYKAAQYDEFLLFKYLLIKGVAHGKMKPVAFDATDAKNAAKSFRGISNTLPFMKSEYNEAGVLTTTPKEKQVIFMDAQYNADYDVEVLAAAFNMDKATFMGRLMLIDDWTSFDNERFAVIRAASDGLEEVTANELALMEDVKAILVDEDWFQVYDNLDKFTEDYLGSGIYWNYWYHQWKTISNSPFANAIVFVDDGADTSLEDYYEFEVVDKSTSDGATVITLEGGEELGLTPNRVHFVQTEYDVEKAVGVHKYGAFLIPANQADAEVHIMIDGKLYKCGTASGTGTITYTETKMATTIDVGDTIKVYKAELFD